MTISDDDLNRMAWTMLGEAKPNDPNALAAVGNVIMNRYAAGGGYGTTILKITRPSQFTTWAPKGQGGNDPQGRFPVSSPYFQKAKAIATQLVNGEIPDNTGGAVNYYSGGKAPSWAAGKNTVNIGGNLFIPNHPLSAGTQLIAQQPDASALDAYASTYGWTSLPDATPTGAPITSVAQAQTTRSPADAIAAIEQATGQPISGAPDALAYGSGPPVQQPVPLAPLPAAPAQPAVAANPPPPIPGPRPEGLSGAAQDAAALPLIKNWLKGSNVNLDAVPPAQQAALMKAIPTIASLAGDPKAELNYLQQSGLYNALVAAVPSHTPNFAESAWASVNGVQLPARLPNDIASWGLPTGSDPNAAIQALTGFMQQAGEQRAPSYTPFDPNDPRGGPLAAPSANALASWAQPYTSTFPGGGTTASSAPSTGGGLAWAQPYFDAQQDNSNGQVLNSGWAQPYFDAQPQQPNFANTGADLASLGIASSVAVPKYITISKQVQVPDDQPIEQGSGGVVWDAASQSFKLQDAPPAAAPRMITKTVQQRVLNPKYTAPAPAAPAPPVNQPITATNGYNYLRNATGGYTNVGQSAQAQGMTPEQQYAAAAARALASQPNGNVNSPGNVSGQAVAHGQAMAHSLGGMPG